MFRRFAALALLLGCSAIAPAEAAAPANPFLARLVGHLYQKGEAFACFSRRYLYADLAKHPEQRVTYAKALVDAYLRKSPLRSDPGSFSYQVSLAFRFRDRSETLTGVAECGGGRPADSLPGGAHCAGPQNASSRLAMAGRRDLLLTIPGGADLWMPGPVEQHHDTVANPFGPDDRVFRLNRTNLAECEDLAFDRQKPLRPHEE